LNTVVLVYNMSLGLQDPANYVTFVGALDLYRPAPPGQGILALLGMSIVSDVTAVFGSTLRRTITLQTTTFGDTLYGGDANQIKAATRNIFRAALGLLAPASVTASEPVVT
jgi:hypothetical protein